MTEERSENTVAPSQDGNEGNESAASPGTDLRERIVEAMKTVYDPEIPVNIYELGMVYEIEIDAEANAVVTMTLTSPSCPVAGTLPLEVEDKVRSVPDVTSARVDVVWDPPWTPDMISEAAKLELGIF